MPRFDEKGKRFEFLIGRMDEAINAGFYVEAMSLTYSLMEERTYSLLDKLQIPYKSRDKLHQCLVYLETHILNRTVTVSPSKKSMDELIDWLKVELVDSGLIKDIQIWRDKRNGITHDLAKQNIAYSSIASYAIEGNTYFRKYTSIIMRLKKLL